MVKIAQIGCGHWGKNLARNFAEIGVLAAISDENPETAKFISEQYKVPALSLDDILSDPSIDGVAYATPAETHASLGIKAFEAGKNVYVEKPLALSLDDAQALIEAGAKQNKILMVGHLLQYHPVFQTLLEHVRSGLVGDINYIYSNRMSLGKFRTEENVLWSFAPHDVSMILALAQSEPETVTTQGASFVTKGVADWSTVQLAFPNNIRGHIQISWLHPFKEQRLVVVGTEGMIVFDDSNAKWEHKLTLYRHRIETSGPVPIPEKAELEYLEVPPGEPLKNECQHFADCIQNTVTPRTDGHEGLAVLKVLRDAEAALQASLEGQ